MNGSKGYVELKKILFLGLGFLLVFAALKAEIRLPHILGNHMVLQQDRPIPIWGWASPGEKIAVTFAGQKEESSADEKGRWAITLQAQKADGQSHRMVISGAQSRTLVLEDILVGEVWVCSGQSNMQWAMLQTHSPTPEILKADYPHIRLFYVPKKVSTTPLDDTEAEWQICSPQTISIFSAVGYYFGREIHLEMDVPVGLINSNWGGTRIEPWTPEPSFRAVPELAAALEDIKSLDEVYRNRLETVLPEMEKWVQTAKNALSKGLYVHPQPALPPHPHDNNRTPTVLYNAMIHPLIRFPIRGAIWYQGEANRNDGLLYKDKMKALIYGWRSVWGLGDFPFYYVQLAPFSYAYVNQFDETDIPDFERLPLIWGAQLKALEIPNTGMAVVTDISNLDDIHPRNKKDVGYRLALWALAKTYGKKDIVYSGPLYKSMSVEGAKVRIHFDHTGSGLISLDDRPLTWFEIASKDGTFYKAQAEIDGETVLVWNERIREPAAVRLGWHQLATPNLGNKEGLPASPFRTDRQR